MPGVHAKLSASGAKKWLACPGSVVLEAECKESSSTYAAEGTTAHALGEAKIRLAAKAFTKAKYHKAVKDLAIDEDMEDYTDSYRDFVLEQYAALQRDTPDAVLLLEQRLDFSDYAPEGFGTGDCVLVGDGLLHIIDLKYGKGVRVNAKENPQLRLYGLGALAAFDFLYDIQRVKMTIYQPRLDHTDSEELTAEELRAWGEQIKPKAEKAFAGVQEFCPGDHCDSGFCKARPFCRAYAEKRGEMAKYDFAKPSRLSPEEISEVVEQSEALAKWATLVKDYALDEAVNHGAVFPGYKVVEGRSNRTYGAEEPVIAGTLIAQGYNEDEIWPRKLKTVTALEKYLGKKTFQELLGEYVVKPPGKPVLVAETDPRPALHSAAAAAADFAEQIEEGTKGGQKQ